MRKGIRRFLGFGAACLALLPMAALAQVTQTQQTATYKFTVEIGPLATMLMPDQAAGASSGEVMVQMPGMPMPPMAMMDQGQPVNHHVEAHVYSAATGAVMDNVMPTLTITNQAAGASRKLDPVMAMYDLKAGKSDFHYGNNVYLPDGTYTVTVQVGNETATFKDLVVAGPTCQFVLGFKTLHDMAPGDVGGCLDYQSFAANGDALQHTTKGLMVWRKADNNTAFTDGYQTWVNGPTGLARRLNTQRFAWESDFGAPGTTAASSPVAAPAPVPTASPMSMPPASSAPAPASPTPYMPAM